LIDSVMAEGLPPNLSNRTHL